MLAAAVGIQFVAQQMLALQIVQPAVEVEVHVAVSVVVGHGQTVHLAEEIVLLQTHGPGDILKDPGLLRPEILEQMGIVLVPLAKQ